MYGVFNSYLFIFYFLHFLVTFTDDLVLIFWQMSVSLYMVISRGSIDFRKKFLPIFTFFCYD